MLVIIYNKKIYKYQETPGLIGKNLNFGLLPIIDLGKLIWFSHE